MIGPATPLTPSPERSGLHWIQIREATVAKISGELPAEHEWRRFLDHLRPCSRPLVLWLRGRVWLRSAGRTELAAAIGSSTVALVVDDDIGRGFATALRWMDSDVHPFGLAELDAVDTMLGLPSGMTLSSLQQLM